MFDKTTKNKAIAVAARYGLAAMAGMVAFTCLSERAAAYQTGVADCKGTREPGSDTWTCKNPLPVGPGPGGGGVPINPNDYGMCGILSLAGTFDNSTVAHIIIDNNGYYALQRSWVGGGAQGGPEVGWTCVRLTEFTMLPSNLDFRTSRPPPVTVIGSTPPFPGITSPIGGAKEACIWAGVAGGLAPTGPSREFANLVYAEVDETADPWVPGVTLHHAQATTGSTVSTYVFCSWFTTSYPWVYYPHSNAWYGDVGTGKVEPLTPAVSERYWCYMDGVGTYGGTFSAALLPATSSVDYSENISTKETLLIWNCLPLSQ